MGHFLVSYIYIFDIIILFRFSNNCVGGINPFGLFCDSVYCFQSHFSLSIGMVIRCFSVSSYMCAVSFCICMVHESTFISLSELHSFIEMCTSGMINGGGIYLVSLFCSGVKLAFIMFL